MAGLDPIDLGQRGKYSYIGDIGIDDGSVASPDLCRQKGCTFLYQLNLPVPHVVSAIGILFLFSQSGLLSRTGAQLGLLEFPKDFPVVVRDKYGIGMMLSFIWKEVPFVGVIVLAVLQALGVDYEDLARSLGANRWQRFRYVILPLVMPGLLSG